MIKVQFTKDITIIDVARGLRKAVVLMNEWGINEVSFTKNRVMLWGYDKKNPYEECRYKVGLNEAVFKICENYTKLGKLIMFYLTQALGIEAFITTEESRIFYGGDLFYLVKNGKVYKMKDGFEQKSPLGYEIECEIDSKNVRGDMKEFVEKSLIEIDD